MGSKGGKPSPPEPHEMKPDSPRSGLARQIVRTLGHHVINEVLAHERYLNRSRECYDVAGDLYDERRALSRLVRSIVPGSSRLDNGMSLEERIVMVYVLVLQNELIRPGPTPEDRVASEMAFELGKMQLRLEQLIADVIRVDDEARKLV